MNIDKILQIVEEAFREGFCSRETYNDSTVNDEDEEWEKLRSYYLRKARAALQPQKPESISRMLSAVLRMPFDISMADHVSRTQFYQRAQQALDELETLQSQDREDAERYRWLRDKARVFKQDPDMNGNHYWMVRINGALRGTTIDAAIDRARRIEGDGE